MASIVLNTTRSLARLSDATPGLGRDVVIAMSRGASVLPSQVPRLTSWRYGRDYAWTQASPIMTLVGSQPERSRKLFHGTPADRAAQIAKEGFDISRSGQNYMGWSIAGPGVYLSTDRQMARDWGWRADPRQHTCVIEVYFPQSPHFRFKEVPPAWRRYMAEFIEKHQEVHAFVLRSSHSHSGGQPMQEVLLTRWAQIDPKVDIGYRVTDATPRSKA